MAAKKVAIITGASSGIGRATAIALCEAGWNVVLSARRQTELEESARLCTEARVASRGEVTETEKVAVAVVGDVTKEEDVKVLFETGIAEYGK
jgi:NAD(P)-dependent dehydrogenase (short-subunit alcohol dehydrogenase family)